MVVDEFRLFLFLVTKKKRKRFLIDHFHFCLCFFKRVRDKLAVIDAMSVDPVYLRHKHAEKVIDLRVNFL